MILKKKKATTQKMNNAEIMRRTANNINRGENKGEKYDDALGERKQLR
jgi:hypothetical protein